MHHRFLILAIRHAQRHLTSSLVNILGLTTGITIGILVYSYVSWEQSFDTFYPNHDRIYRVSFQKFIQGANSESLAKSPSALANTIREDLSEARHTTKVYPATGVTIAMGEKRFNEKQVYGVDAHFVDVFSPTMLHGTSEGLGVLIAESVAKRYFSSPAWSLGQSIEILGEDHTLSQVIGVFEDLPANTHFPYEILFVQAEEAESELSWRFTGAYTYTLLSEGVNADQFEEQLNKIVTEKSKGTFDAQVTTQVNLQPLTSIHLYSNLQEEITPNGSYQLLLLLIIIGLIVPTVAIINSVNIYTAQALNRTKEVGIRKILGTTRSRLVQQFITEGSLYSFIGVSLALGSSTLLLPSLAKLSGKPLSWTQLYSDSIFWAAIVGVFLITAFALALYPSLLLSSVNPSRAIKGLSQISGPLFLRKGLITFQFVATTFVMITVLLIHQQLKFMRGQDLGIDVDQLVAIKAPSMEKEEWSEERKSYVIDSEYSRLTHLLEEKLASFSSMQVASVSHVPGSELVWGTEGFRREGSSPDEVHFLHMQGVDDQFVEVFDATVLAGRNFSERYTTDQFNTVLLNESAIRTLGFSSAEEAVGKHLIFYDDSQKLIVGVLQDFHQESLQQAIKPTFYELLPRALDYLVVKIPEKDIKQSMAVVQAQWNKVFPNSPFDYFFLDDFYHRHYHDEQQFFRISSLFMLLCLVIALMGLFGLSIFVISRRTKEISIRKVLGAPLAHLAFLLMKGLLSLACLGFLFAAPIAYWLLNKWLQEYAYRTEWQWWIFAFPLLLLVGLSVLTTGGQSVKQALRNPADILRND
ncbi:ABC transporter permease [Tunicatimonas pelagia]|uniref:ABC transporter permease n=1 Tax=Tunicatimonas pelagia TaxID=931531 RepID=UPI002665382E|nr:ABC transporter permease [Tunicatimonas pelagia]WKN44783.1 ABC transporter permease [Tunicatimonas pelagia]